MKTFLLFHRFCKVISKNVFLIKFFSFIGFWLMPRHSRELEIVRKRVSEARYNYSKLCPCRSIGCTLWELWRCLPVRMGCPYKSRHCPHRVRSRLNMSYVWHMNLKVRRHNTSHQIIQGVKNSISDKKFSFRKSISNILKFQLFNMFECSSIL